MRKTNEWYTPKRIIEDARRVMGAIDLDPASCEIANQTVNAEYYYTKERDGLCRPWYGCIWLNPPYGRVKPENTGSTQSYQKAFAEKLLKEVKAQRCEQAIMLSLGNPNCVWFQPFFEYPICFYKGTLEFTRADGGRGHFGFPQCFVYIGVNKDLFVKHFSKYGRIVLAIG